MPCVERDFYLGNETFEYYHFKYPVRVGNLLFYNLEFSLSSRQRTDIAVREFYFTSKKGASSKHDFLRICEQLNKDLSHEQVDEYLENLYYDNHKGDISFRMQYNGEARRRDFFLFIYNARNYEEIIKPVENDIQLTEYLVFPPKTIQIDDNYREDISVKRRPPILTEKFGDKAVLWRDEVNGQIGVSVGDFCNIFPLSSIKKVDIDRMLPAKGDGADSLRVHYKNRKYPRIILSTQEYELDNFLPQLEKFFAKRIKVVGFYYNC